MAAAPTARSTSATTDTIPPGTKRFVPKGNRRLRVAGARTLGVQVNGTGDFHRLYEAGLPATTVKRMAEALGMQLQVLLPMVDLTSSTYANYRRRRVIPNKHVSNALIDLATVYEAAEEFFGNADDARRWLQAPSPTFNGKSPLEYARYPGGQEYVTTVLARIEAGVHT